MLSEADIRNQMFLTMQALERAANAYVLSIQKAPVESSKTVPAPTAPLDSDLKQIRETLDKHRKALAIIGTFLDKHRKALAIIGTFGEFKKIFFGTHPNEKVHSLVGLKSCSCVGTGWVARDETCSECGQKGYIEA